MGSYTSRGKWIEILSPKVLGDEKFKSALYHEIQHAVQDIEGFAYGSKNHSNNETNYFILHGEAEARNIEKRLNMPFNSIDEAQARGRYKLPHPHETMDIKPKDTIAEADIHGEAFSMGESGKGAKGDSQRFVRI